MVHYGVEVFMKICCIGLLIFQGCLLNAYLSILHSHWWWVWSIADVMVIILWSFSLILAARSFHRAEVRKHKAEQDCTDGRDPEKQPDEIKYAYIAWIAYVALLCPRVIVLFRKHASTLDERNILGPNFLKVAISCSPLIFLLLVRGHHNAKPHTSRKYFIKSLAGTVTLDLFDSIDLLEFLFIPESQRLFPRACLDATLAFACINLFLPALALSEIRVNSFTGRVTSLPFKLLYVSFYVFLVNVPNLIIRSVLWHQYSADVSVLLMKNVMCIALGILEIYEYFGDDRPVKCDRCGNWYEKCYFPKHKEHCEDTETTRLHNEQL